MHCLGPPLLKAMSQMYEKQTARHVEIECSLSIMFVTHLPSFGYMIENHHYHRAEGCTSRFQPPLEREKRYAMRETETHSKTCMRNKLQSM